MKRGERSTSSPSPLTLCGHPQRCVDSPSLWNHPRHCGAPFRRGAATPDLYNTSALVSKTLELMYECRPDVNAGRTTLEAAPRRVQGCHDTRKSRDS
jgi:hypothetical protein